MVESMKKYVSLSVAFVIVLVVCLFPCFAAATEENENPYAPYNNFEELYDAYMKALEDEDVPLQEKLVAIGRKSLRAEIAEGKESGVKPYIDSELEYWNSVFTRYFSYGYFEVRPNGWCLSLGNKLSYWNAEDKSQGWNATYAKFYKDPHWDNTDIMEEQFYCHARLVYAAIEKEWNLEPWKTSMDPITCN